MAKHVIEEKIKELEKYKNNKLMESNQKNLSNLKEKNKIEI